MRRIQEDSVLSLRLAPEEAQLLKQEAEARGTSVSKVARRAIATGLKPVRMQSRRISYALGSRSPDVDLGIATFGGSTDWGSTSSTAVTLRLG
jgi:hypothetical protein